MTSLLRMDTEPETDASGIHRATCGCSFNRHGQHIMPCDQHRSRFFRELDHQQALFIGRVTVSV